MDMVGAAGGLTDRFNRNAGSVMGRARDVQKPEQLLLIVGLLNVYCSVRS